jgi:hypothetical protein
LLSADILALLLQRLFSHPLLWNVSRNGRPLFPPNADADREAADVRKLPTAEVIASSFHLAPKLAARIIDELHFSDKAIRLNLSVRHGPLPEPVAPCLRTLSEVGPQVSELLVRQTGGVDGKLIEHFGSFSIPVVVWKFGSGFLRHADVCSKISAIDSIQSCQFKIIFTFSDFGLRNAAAQLRRSARKKKPACERYG